MRYLLISVGGPFLPGLEKQRREEKNGNASGQFRESFNCFLLGGESVHVKGKNYWLTPARIIFHILI